jgi:predicted O-linked N-acetylglucosamine transferase (SPINDLY family)
MDYFLSSELLDDESSQDHYTEQLIRMPLTGTYYERPLVPPNTASIRKRLGLPDDRHLYACPQSLFKFHPDDDIVLRGILEADPNGVLIVIEGRVPEWTIRLKSRWEKTLGRVSSQVLFIPAIAHTEYLSLLHECDVMLDPLHFGGGNSSYEALAMGTPVVTLPSAFLRGRITSALYRKMKMMDCVVHSQDEYISLATRLGTDREFRKSVSQKIDAASRVLFSDPAEVRCLEEALLQCVAKGGRG